ncbi:hypothetical protein [uncultured Planococcus sp.]|uniref:hypothetical protein n=1 Tax=Planococcus donghaensis TaxID=414778 RepID=UPI002611C7BB|nr:hypothetical protein [uncultured Planococcus sp.]
MWPTIATVFLLIAIGFAVNKIIKKRKESSITDLKSLGTSICFFLIAIVNILAYWFDFIGIISMSLTILLLITGAYCSRYLQTDHETYPR